MRRPSESARYLLLVLTMVAITSPSAAAQESVADVVSVHRLLGRGINLGNALEAPEVGAWGLDIKSEYLQAIADAGFDSVRLPVRWSAHAEHDSPYRIDPEFFAIVDDVINGALSRRLAIVVNFHHYEELYADPEKERTRFLALWDQVAVRYKDRPVGLLFEILNEPHGELTHERWQKLFPDALAVIRKSNPHRAVIIGPGQWNNVGTLPQLRLPEEDRMLIGTFHYYEPFRFTHQQAGWVEGSSQWKDVRWQGTSEEVQAIADDFDRAKRWSQEHNRPLFLGEFGAYSAADLPSRARWTRAVANAAGERGFAFAYWEFGAGFGAYDRTTDRWRQPLKDALLSSQR